MYGIFWQAVSYPCCQKLACLPCVGEDDEGQVCSRIQNLIAESVGTQWTEFVFISGKVQEMPFAGETPQGCGWAGGLLSSGFVNIKIYLN